MLSASQEGRWTVLADGVVGMAVLRILSRHYASSVACVVTTGDAHDEIKKLFPHAEYITQEYLKRNGPNRLRGKADIILLAWWPQILGKNYFDLGQRIMLNMHPSLLPYGRGKDPNFWGLIEGFPLGVTIHHVSEKVDEGSIAFQRELSVSWSDTGETVYRRSQEALIKLFDDVHSQISAMDVPSRPQDANIGSTHTRSELHAASKINLDNSYTARQLLNMLRARTFDGHPSCWFQDEGKEFEVVIRIKEKNECSGRL